MSLLQAPTLIRAHALALLPISYYLLTSPSTIMDQNLVFMLGEAMSLPHPSSTLFSAPSPTSALIALLLALLALTDLSAFSLEEDSAHFYWRSAVPLRLLFFFAVTGGSYLGAEGAGAILKGAPRTMGGRGRGAAYGGVSEACCNSLVFTWGFLEMVFWFWVFVRLREEGKVMAGKKALERKKKEDEEGEEERM